MPTGDAVMPHSNNSCSVSSKFDWETRFYRCLLLPHIELADRASEAASILAERVRQATSRVIPPSEQEALDDARQHLRKIQVLQLGFPEIAGEFAARYTSALRNNAIGQSSRDLPGRAMPLPLSDRRHLWKFHTS